jgi:hypothetical protein
VNTPETTPPLTGAEKVFGGKKRFNLIIEILVANFFICLSIKYLRA